ncbi:MAG TPA: hypothetical protein PKX75_22245, partial [Nitrospira sp.]|nr:hypothetical protein [Nitrospira sp.]
PVRFQDARRSQLESSGHRVLHSFPGWRISELTRQAQRETQQQSPGRLYSDAFTHLLDGLQFNYF